MVELFDLIIEPCFVFGVYLDNWIEGCYDWYDFEENICFSVNESIEFWYWSSFMFSPRINCFGFGGMI